VSGRSLWAKTDPGKTWRRKFLPGSVQIGSESNRNRALSFRTMSVTLFIIRGCVHAEESCCFCYVAGDGNAVCWSGQVGAACDG